MKKIEQQGSQRTEPKHIRIETAEQKFKRSKLRHEQLKEKEGRRRESS